MLEENLKEFEEQLRQEEVQRKLIESDKLKIDEDGTMMEWDEGRRAWFPKLDEDFIAKYQLSYGSHAPIIQREKQVDSQTISQQWTDYYEALKEGNQEDLIKYYNSAEYRSWYAQYMQNTTEASEDTVLTELASSKPVRETKKGKHAVDKRDDWYEVDPFKNTHVYVSGLPLDINDEEFEDMMKKFGMIMKDPVNEGNRIKLYRNDEGLPKGDGRCCYIKIESVQLAIDLLDGAVVRGSTIHVEQARFEKKGNFDPSKRRRLTKKEKQKLKEHEENLFRWGPERSRFLRPKFENTIVIQNAFHPEEFLNDPLRIDTLKEKLEEHCAKCGTVKKIIVYDNNPKGVATVQFGSPADADIAVSYFNGKLMQQIAGGLRHHVLEVAHWDGKTNYKREETIAERDLRMEKWHKDIAPDAQTTSDIPSETPNKNEFLLSSFVSKPSDQHSSVTPPEVAGLESPDEDGL